MLMLINDPEIMGRHVNSILFDLVAWGTAAAMIALTLLHLLASVA
jgi:Mn2+/Fe2+ NRAMP family transporter